MLISNVTQRFKSLTFIILLCAIPLSCFSQDSDLLSPIALQNRLLETLPIENRVIDNLESFEELYDDLLIAEITTIGGLDTLVQNQLPKVLDIEKEICKQMKEGEELTAYVPNGTYSAEIEDVPSIQEGIYFTVVGLVRTMIDLIHPSEEDDSDNINETEL